MTKDNAPRNGASGGAGVAGNRQPDDTTGAITTSRPRVGDIVSVPGIGRCHVIRDDDPSLLTVQNAQGVEFKVGERSVERLDGGGR